MKSEIIFPLICMLLLCIADAKNSMAQQSTYAPNANFLTKQMMQLNTVGDYSYQILPASNNSFGYDIYQNRRLIFHQPILTFMATNGRRSFPERDQAQKIVLIAIEKIKKGKLPILTNEEIKTIAR